MMWTTLPRSELTQHLQGWRGGAGPAMLLIHGVGMRADFWSHLVPDLEKTFSLSIVDMPGHGLSECLLADSPGLADYTDVMADLLVAQEKPSIVVGHSMGALIALDLAVRYPHCVSGLAVLNGVYRRSKEALISIQARVEALSSDERPESGTTIARWFGTDPTGVDRQASDACQRWLAQADQAGYHDAYRAFAQGDAPDDRSLQCIRQAALFMTGALEPNSTPAMSLAMSELVTESRRVIVEKARHMMPLTHGGELTSQLIDMFSAPDSSHDRV